MRRVSRFARTVTGKHGERPGYIIREPIGEAVHPPLSAARLKAPRGRASIREFDQDEIAGCTVCFAETRDDGKTTWINVQMLHNSPVMVPACDIHVARANRSCFKREKYSVTLVLRRLKAARIGERLCIKTIPKEKLLSYILFVLPYIFDLHNCSGVNN